MSRSISSVIVGLGFAMALVYGADLTLASVLPDSFDPGQPVFLVSLLLYDVLVFALAGWLTGRLARRAEVMHALACGLLVLLAGVATVAEVHDGLPMWWHVTVLLLAVPAVLLGGAVQAFRNLPQEI